MGRHSKARKKMIPLEELKRQWHERPAESGHLRLSLPMSWGFRKKRNKTAASS